MKKIVSLLLCLTLLMGLANAVAEEKVTYTTLYSSEVTTLNYLITSTTNEFAIAANLIDTLVEYDMYGRMQPSLATAWENSEDGLTWTFTLRQDATWVDGNDEVVAPVTANDFVAAAKYILNAQNASAPADILYGVIDGAEAYYLGTATPEEGQEPAPATEWDTVGVKALDDYTLQYTLDHPVPYFLSMLTYVCFMPVYEPFLQEKGDSFGVATGNDTLLYCGAYYLSQFKPQELRVLSKNENNWDAENVHIDEISSKYNKEASTVSAELYLRGEVDSASLSNELTADWLADEQKASMIHPVRYDTDYYSYFYTFNFDPQFDAIYEPDNWKIAVNNENFRLSIINAFNRIKAKTLLDAENPDMMLYNTITPPYFSEVDGVDYVNMGALAALTDADVNSLNTDAALAYKEAAVAELTEAGATFPVKVLLLYNPNASANNSDQEAQIVEQQLEDVLGTDYIDVIIEAGPSTSYLTARRTGLYGMMNCNWGPDYADPETFTDPFTTGNKYNFMDTANNAQVEEYYALVDAAKAITTDITARYEAFAEAEAYLIQHGFVMPFGHGSGGYTASLLDPFSSPMAPFGISSDRYKGQYKLTDYMDTDAYYDAYDAYVEARDAADAE